MKGFALSISLLSCGSCGGAGGRGGGGGMLAGGGSSRSSQSGPPPCRICSRSHTSPMNEKRVQVTTKQPWNMSEATLSVDNMSRGRVST